MAMCSFGARDSGTVLEMHRCFWLREVGEACWMPDYTSSRAEVCWELMSNKEDRSESAFVLARARWLC